jgi:hypothetical protein
VLNTRLGSASDRRTSWAVRKARSVPVALQGVSRNGIRRVRRAGGVDAPESVEVVVHMGREERSAHPVAARRRRRTSVCGCTGNRAQAPLAQGGLVEWSRR